VTTDDYLLKLIELLKEKLIFHRDSIVVYNTLKKGAFNEDKSPIFDDDGSLYRKVCVKPIEASMDNIYTTLSERY
jgi:hypothetical protein